MPDQGEPRLGDRHVSLHVQVLQLLREKIIQGDYMPGTRLVEETLSAEFGVSRNPIREAMRVAEAEGFVRTLPRRGAIVVTPDASAVADLFVVRATLEPLAARLAAERIDDEQLDGLHATLDAAKRATRRKDYRQLATLNSQFHLQVVAASGNHWLESTTTSIFYHVQWVFRLGVKERAPHSWQEHVALLDALTVHDPDGAHQAALEHVEAARKAAESLSLS